MTTRIRLRVVSLLPLLTGLSLVACGSSSSSQDTATGGGSSVGGGTGTGGTGTGGATGSTGIGGSGTGGAAAGGAAAGGRAAGGAAAGGAAAGGAAAGGAAAGGAAAGGAAAGGAAAGGAAAGGAAAGGATAGGAGPGAGGTDPSAGGTDPGAGGTDPGAGGTDPSAGGTDPGAGGSAVGGNTGTGGEPPIDGLNVQLQEVRQIIRGFGINGTLVKDSKALPWDDLFGLEGPDALGLSILRIGMTEKGEHRDVSSGWETARTTYGARVIGSCWSAPAEWKDNNSTTGGGHLLPEHYADWAGMIADYASRNNLYAMSIGNETDFASCAPSQGRPCDPPLTDEYASMVYTGKELAAFAKVAGPIFDEQAPNTLMMAPEASLWIHVWSNLSPTNKANGGYDSSDPLECNCYSNDINDATALAKCDPNCTENGYDYGHWLLKDDAAWNSVDILGVHEYESQVAYPWPDDVPEAKRNKEIWQTEMSGVMYWPEQGPSTDINNGVAVARWIHSALTVGQASAWLYWWYEAYYQNDNEGLALTQTSGSTIAMRYYTMGNFSRYIRPDVFHAVQVAGPAPDKVLVSAYKGDNEEVVIVAINETTQEVDVPITITGGTVPVSMTPHLTADGKKLEAGTAVPVTDGVLNATLPGMSVTTFVSD